MNNRRIEWLDICKALGIFLVVLGHTYQDNLVKTWIYSFHLPSFFFLSGYVFDSNKYNYRKFTVRRLKSLIVPYFAFAFISYSYWLFLERHFRPSSMSIDIFRPILGYLYGSIGPSLEPNWILWFLPCLFVTEIMFYFVSKVFKKRHLILITLILFSINGYFGLQRGFKLPWGIDVAFNGVVFYGLGYLIKEKMRDHTLDPALYIKVLLFSAFLAINVIFSLKNGMSSIDHDLNNYFYYYVSALSGIGAIIIFSTFLQSARYLSFVGRNTLIILCIHNPIKRIVIKIVATIVHLPVNPFRNSLLGGLICALATTAVTIPFIFLINRYFPFLLGKFGGNRLSRKEVDVRGWHARKNVNN